MTRGIYTKWIIGAVFILLIVATGCILYYQQTTAADKQAAAQADKLLETWKANKTKPPTPAEPESTKPTAENSTPTAEKPTTDEEVATTEIGIQNVSPFGLGPYPKVPEEWNEPNLWEECDTIEAELLERVCIIMHNEGKRYSSIGMEADGLITVVERGTVIVQWETAPDGTQRIWRVLADPKDLPQGIYTSLSHFPTHLNVVNREDVAIDPYEYLGIER